MRKTNMAAYEYRGFTIVVAGKAIVHHGSADGQLIGVYDSLDAAMRAVDALMA